jgi:hypothetical protein
MMEHPGRWKTAKIDNYWLVDLINEQIERIVKERLAVRAAGKRNNTPIAKFGNYVYSQA